METGKRVSMRTRVQAKNELGFGNDNVQLSFIADYEDGRNKEWAEFTPALSFSATVRPEIADMFEIGEKITFYAEATGEEADEGDGDSGE